MFKGITEKFDELFLMEFFQQTKRVNKEKSFKKKILALREFLRICEKHGIKKTSKCSFIQLRRISKDFDPALRNLGEKCWMFMLGKMMPKDTVDSYPNYCKELYGS
jgi:hypothetical protein